MPNNALAAILMVSLVAVAGLFAASALLNDVDDETSTVLYEDEFVKIEYMGNDVYKFTAVQPDDLDWWVLYTEDDEYGTDDVSWTYTLESGENYLDYFSLDDFISYYWIDADSITAGISLL